MQIIIIYYCMMCKFQNVVCMSFVSHAIGFLYPILASFFVAAQIPFYHSIPSIVPVKSLIFEVEIPEDNIPLSSPDSLIFCQKAKDPKRREAIAPRQPVKPIVTIYKPNP